MNAVTPVLPEPPERSHWAERRLALLDEAMECTTQLIHCAKRRAVVSEDAEQSVINLVKCLRQTAALQARLEAGLLPPLRAPRAPPEPTTIDPVQPECPKPGIRRALDDSILDDDPGERAEDLLIDLRERLDDPEFERDLATRPIAQIVAGICQEVGIAFDESLWTEAEPPPDVPPLADPSAPLAIEPQMPRHHARRYYNLQARWQSETNGTPATDPAPD